MVKEKQNGEKGTLAHLVPHDLLDAKIQKPFPILLEQILLVVEVQVKGRTSDVRPLDQILNGDVVKTLLSDQIEHGVVQVVLGSLDAPVCLLAVSHVRSFLNIKKVFVH